MAEKLGEISDRLLLLTTQLREAEKLMAAELNPDVIAVQLIERVRDLSAFLESREVEDQRKSGQVDEVDVPGPSPIVEALKLPLPLVRDKVLAPPRERALPAVCVTDNHVHPIASTLLVEQRLERFLPLLRGHDTLMTRRHDACP